jgi:UDP-N-acetylmuramate dehydrogenase
VDVPGTVGGAVVGNAGAFGGYVSDSLRGVSVFDVVGEHWLPANELGLSYRSSAFKQRRTPTDQATVILSALFSLRKQDPDALRARAAEFTSRRSESQPQGLSAGSVFKRTAQYPAGFLIENAGLKGFRLGGAVVSPLHANFIINEASASAHDVCRLIEIIRETVQDKFKTTLELEIELVGDWEQAEKGNN